MSPRPTPPAQKALWGPQEPVPVAKPPKRAECNDRDLFGSVVKTAADPGYVVIGPSERVFIREPGSKHQVNPVPRYEADMVAQMLDAGHLRTGGYHHVTYGDREGPANSVLVPKATRALVRRWDALHRLPRQRDT